MLQGWIWIIILYIYICILYVSGVKKKHPKATSSIPSVTLSLTTPHTVRIEIPWNVQRWQWNARWGRIASVSKWFSVLVYGRRYCKILKVVQLWLQNVTNGLWYVISICYPGSFLYHIIHLYYAWMWFCYPENVNVAYVMLPSDSLT